MADQIVQVENLNSVTDMLYTAEVGGVYWVYAGNSNTVALREVLQVPRQTIRVPDAVSQYTFIRGLPSKWVGNSANHDGKYFYPTDEPASSYTRSHLTLDEVIVSNLTVRFQNFTTSYEQAVYQGYSPSNSAGWGTYLAMSLGSFACGYSAKPNANNNNDNDKMLWNACLLISLAQEPQYTSNDLLEIGFEALGITL